MLPLTYFSPAPPSLPFASPSVAPPPSPSLPLPPSRPCSAGSHDLALGTQVLHELRTLTQPSASAAVPRYDKSAFQGLGDRAPQEVWPRVEGPLDLVLFEGWMLGFRPLGQDAAAAVDPNLAQVGAKCRQVVRVWVGSRN